MYATQFALPITQNQQDEHPQFVSLLNDLCTRFHENGSTRKQSEELSGVQEKLRIVKLEHARAQLMVNTLSGVVRGTTNNHNSQFSTMERILTLTDVENCVLQSSSYKLLNCTGDEVQHEAQLHQQQISLTARHKVLDEVTRRLRTLYDTLSAFYDTDEENMPTPVTDNRFSLHVHVDADLCMMRKGESHTTKLRLDCNRQAVALFEALCDNIDICSSLVKTHKLQLQSTFDEAKKSWLIDKLTALRMKVEVVKCEVLKNTYSPNTVKALVRIRALLEEAGTECEQVLRGSCRRLREYEDIGDEFRDLVNQYVTTEENVEKVQWTLNELHKY